MPLIESHQMFQSGYVIIDWFSHNFLQIVEIFVSDEDQDELALSKSKIVWFGCIGTFCTLFPLFCVCVQQSVDSASFS